ncbi:unnamed protein product [Tenebrio molitor]|nr:unnamed protein product [Tenebrio molitor]
MKLYCMYILIFNMYFFVLFKDIIFTYPLHNTLKKRCNVNNIAFEMTILVSNSS